MTADQDGLNQPGNGYEETNGNTLESGAPAVASRQGRVFLFLVVALVAGFILYSIFGGDDGKKKDTTAEPQKTPVVRSEPPPPLPTPVVTPPPPQVTLPPPPQLPPPPAETVPSVSSFSTVGGPGDKERQARLRSAMVIQNQGGLSKALSGTKSTGLAGSDPNTTFAQSAMTKTEADTATATTIGNLNAKIAQGKIINAVLETAINTDLPGTLRAIVSRDVYAEAGREVLVPKGSRLIGTYNTGILRGQKRVFIIWTRIIRPDGVDIQVGSPGVDSLGRAGVEGYVDNKYFEAFTSAFLTSAVSIGVAYAAESISGNDSTSTTTNTDGSTTTNSTTTGQATTDAVANIGGVGKRIMQDMLDMRPTITIDQGTRISVMVNRDLEFPESVVAQTRFIQ